MRPEPNVPARGARRRSGHWLSDPSTPARAARRIRCHSPPLRRTDVRLRRALPRLLALPRQSALKLSLRKSLRFRKSGRRRSSAKARLPSSPLGQRGSDRSRCHGLRLVAGAAAQSRKCACGQGHRSHRVDPRNFWPPGADAEGALQVEHAHLAYQKSRLVRSWTHLERQRGGFGFLGGPGETQIEADRRRIEERMTRIERDLEGVKRDAWPTSSKPPRRALLNCRAGRLHERRKIHTVQ